MADIELDPRIDLHLSERGAKVLREFMFYIDDDVMTKISKDYDVSFDELQTMRTNTINVLGVLIDAHRRYVDFMKRET